MSVWKRNAVVVAIVLFVGAAVYLNWSYSSQTAEGGGNGEGGGKLLGQTTLVNGEDGGKDAAGQASGAPDAAESSEPEIGRAHV